MPEERPTKPRAKRTAKPAAAGARRPVVRTGLHVGFRLPEWRSLPPTAPTGSLEYRAARGLAKVIVALCQNQADAPAGVLTLDIETPCDPNTEEGFPSAYATGLAQQIRHALPAIFKAGDDRPFPIPLKHFPDLGEVKVVARFKPAQEAVAPAADPVHTGGQSAIVIAEPPVTEGSTETAQRGLVPEPTRLDAVYQERAKEFFEGLPADPGHQFQVVADRIDTFRRQAIPQLESAVNAFLASQEPRTFQEKQAIVESINSKLDKIGVSIQYKGQACNLIAALSGGSPSGRFHLVPKGSSVPVFARVNLADFLPLKLIDAPRRFAARER